MKRIENEEFIVIELDKSGARRQPLVHIFGSLQLNGTHH
jgi:hypothetical protein